ncbi:MAG TPA: F0F1 ATP synthase subunit delta [Arachnia sp.]|nr:F0F1 ATP synthase subunit delta [Arachnia sp.]
MTARDAAIAKLDGVVDGIATDADTAAELFAVVDVLDGQPMLRRSLSDPSASDESRAELVNRLLAGKVSPATLAVLEGVVKAPHRSGNALVAALDRQGVRLALRQARESGQLDAVVAELFQVSSLVGGNAELEATLRNPAYPVEAKRGLVAKLIAGRVSPTTAALANRAVNARRRTFGLTVQGYLDMAAKLAGQRIARVTVARELDEARVARLTSALEAQVGSPVTVQVTVDPAVLGGVNVSLGDDVYESTVAARLEDARRQLINL